MQKIKYTFIIPAYNSQDSIRKCLDSICQDIKSEAETILDSEIIVIENGSSDSTEEIVNEYISGSDCNIKLFHSEKGVSKARNTGINVSNGKMIIFVDSDDLWLYGSLKEINKDIENNNPDLLVYSFLKGRLQDNNKSCLKVLHNPNFKQKSNQVDSAELKRAWLISRPTLRMQVWAKVFRSDLIKENKILFDENIRYSEDSEFVIRYLKVCENIYISNHPIYKYIISEGSTMRSIDQNRINQYVNSLRSSEAFLANESEIIRKAFRHYVLMHLNIILVHDVFNVKKDLLKNFSFIDDYRKMKTIMKESIFCDTLKQTPLSECFSILFLPELFMKIHLNLFVGFMCYIRSYSNQKK